MHKDFIAQSALAIIHVHSCSSPSKMQAFFSEDLLCRRCTNMRIFWYRKIMFSVAWSATGLTHKDHGCIRNSLHRPVVFHHGIIFMWYCKSQDLFVQFCYVPSKTYGSRNQWVSHHAVVYPLGVTSSVVWHDSSIGNISASILTVLLYLFGGWWGYANLLLLHSFDLVVWLTKRNIWSIFWKDFLILSFSILLLYLVPSMNDDDFSLVLLSICC